MYIMPKLCCLCPCWDDSYPLFVLVNIVTRTESESNINIFPEMVCKNPAKRKLTAVTTV